MYFLKSFMARRKIEEKNVRKIQRSGNSYCVSLPIDLVRKFKWKEKQKVVIKESGKRMVIEDWK